MTNPTPSVANPTQTINPTASFDAERPSAPESVLSKILCGLFPSEDPGLPSYPFSLPPRDSKYLNRLHERLERSESYTTWLRTKYTDPDRTYNLCCYEYSAFDQVLAGFPFSESLRLDRELRNRFRNEV